jgi:predicted HD superfamily hydrolase involved in NAD metabolism
MPIVDSPRSKEFVHLLRERVSEQTARHSVFTAALMSSFAGDAGVGNEQAVTSGLLHDLYKDADDATLVATAEKWGIVPSETQRNNPGLLHGALAAADCRLNLGVSDVAVLEAIEWHTTGKPGLCAVGLALYLADFAEPSRRHGAAAEARDILRREGFRKALLYASDRKLEHVTSMRDIDPMTVAFHGWLVEFLGSNG